jgi:hypothetical protein
MLHKKITRPGGTGPQTYFLSYLHRALARQNTEDVPGPAGDLFCLDFSCFILFVKKKNEVGFGAKLPDEC